ncbi:uncharacterized protein SCHCODRAFT_01352163 [Schizophyllum commune H4-8]|nr:uncharacterized protein SCHCODRAFT_01352163 [Schizophyllum commune H4-8]KAI5892043.1 hypothetical protein SCHCODRAFT_01352163 [Schizophyllum commune H4-8]
MQSRQSLSPTSRQWTSTGLFNLRRSRIRLEPARGDDMTVPWHYRAAGYTESDALPVPTSHATMPATYDDQHWALPNSAPTASQHAPYMEPSPWGYNHPHHAPNASASHVHQASSPEHLGYYGYPSGSPAYNTFAHTPTAYARHSPVEASSPYLSSERFVDYRDGFMADAADISDPAHANGTTYFNHSPDGFPSVPPPDVAVALAPDPFPTPGTSRLPSAVATASPEDRHDPLPRNEVGTSHQREAAQRRRRTAARLYCPYPGCEASFTRGHNCRSSWLV